MPAGGFCLAIVFVKRKLVQAVHDVLQDADSEIDDNWHHDNERIRNNSPSGHVELVAEHSIVE